MSSVLTKANWRKLSRSLDIAGKARLRWRLQARPNQLTPGVHALCSQPVERCEQALTVAQTIRDPTERVEFLRANGHFPWFIWIMTAGRGFGKTLSGAEDMIRYANEHPGCRIGLIGPTTADVRDTMCEGTSGILGRLPPSLLTNWNRSLGELILTNGSRMKAFSAETPDRLRGPQHHRLWMEEFASWEYLQATYDMALFGLRLGKDPQIVITTTPRPLPFIREMIAKSKDPAGGIVVTTGTTFDNAKNLAQAALAELKATYEGTRIGKQELEGIVLDDLEGALWSHTMIEQNRIAEWTMPDPFQYIGRTVIAVDPAVSSNEHSDSTGIVVVALTNGPCRWCNRADRAHAVVLEDLSGRHSPREWSLIVQSAYRRWQADLIVAEVNQGGDLVVSNLVAGDINLPVRTIHATKGKLLRAEPVYALYEKGSVHHFGGADLLELEKEMVGFDPTVKTNKSPDRLDALVYGLTTLMLPKTGLGPSIVKDSRHAGRR